MHICIQRNKHAMNQKNPRIISLRSFYTIHQWKSAYQKTKILSSELKIFYPISRSPKRGRNLPEKGKKKNTELMYLLLFKLKMYHRFSCLSNRKFCLHKIILFSKLVKKTNYFNMLCSWIRLFFCRFLTKKECRRVFIVSFIPYWKIWDGNVLPCLISIKNSKWHSY